MWHIDVPTGINLVKIFIFSVRTERRIPDLFPSMNNTFNVVKDNILYNISGSIVGCLFKKVHCQTCANSM